MSISYALFDLDGTLSESAPGITRSVQYALAALGIEEPDLKKLESFVGPPLNIEFKRLYGLDDDQIAFAVEKYRENYNAGAIYDCCMYPGTTEMLAACKGAGIRLAVASSKPEVMVVKILQNYGIYAYFDLVCGSEIDEEKRQAGTDQKSFIVNRALTSLRRQASGSAASDADFKRSCAMIGDRSFDMIGAKDNGLIAIGVSFGYGSEAELAESGADFIAHDMTELTALLTVCS